MSPNCVKTIARANQNHFIVTDLAEKRRAIDDRLSGDARGQIGRSWGSIRHEPIIRDMVLIQSTATGSNAATLVGILSASPAEAS
jgi:hypothetical protein